MVGKERTWVDDLFDEVITEDKARKSYVPRVGDVIYIPSEDHWDYEALSFRGGKAEVYKIVRKGNTPAEGLWYVRASEHELAAYSWEYLRELQGELEEQFGDCWASPAVMY